MSTITIDPSERTTIFVPGLGEIEISSAGLIVTPADGVTHEQVSTGFAFSRGLILPLLSEKLEEAALMAYCAGRPAVDQLRDRLRMLAFNHPTTRVADSFRPHADVIPYRWAGHKGVGVPPEEPMGYSAGTVGYVFYTRDGQAITANIRSDGTVSSGVPFDWPTEAGEL